MGGKNKGEGVEAEKVKDAVIVVPQVAVSQYTEEKASVEKMILAAVEKGLPIDTMERVMAMRDKLKAEYAKEQFDHAMASFQMECPEIKKTKVVKDRDGKVLYHYAPIDVVVSQTKAIIAKHGLSYFIKTENLQNEKKETLVKTTCIVKHLAGHSEESSMEVPLGAKTSIMSDSQVIAAASTFSKRYAFCNAFGIMTGDEDDEKQLAEAPADEVAKAIAEIGKCTTEEGLMKVWRALSKEAKGTKAIIVKANEIKALIKDAQEQGV